MVTISGGRDAQATFCRSRQAGRAQAPGFNHCIEKSFIFAARKPIF